MNAVIHLLKNGDLLNNLDNLFNNKSFYQVGFKHFVISNIKCPQKTLFQDIEQIFFTEDIDFKIIFNVIKTLKELNYENVLVINSDKKEECGNKLFKIDDILNNLSVIDNFIEF